MIRYRVCCVLAGSAFWLSSNQLNLRSTTIMNVIHLIARVAQGLLAATITFAFALVFQFGHLA